MRAVVSVILCCFFVLLGIRLVYWYILVSVCTGASLIAMLTRGCFLGVLFYMSTKYDTTCISCVLLTILFLFFSVFFLTELYFIFGTVEWRVDRRRKSVVCPNFGYPVV